MQAYVEYLKFRGALRISQSGILHMYVYIGICTYYTAKNTCVTRRLKRLSNLTLEKRERRDYEETRGFATTRLLPASTLYIYVSATYQVALLLLLLLLFYICNIPAVPKVCVYVSKCIVLSSRLVCDNCDIYRKKIGR